LTQPAKPKYNKRRKVVFRMGTGKQYSEEYKKEAVKLAKEIGNKAAAEELGIPKGTIWDMGKQSQSR